MIAEHFPKYLKRGFTAVVACFLLNSSAFAYIPAVHDAMHCHEDKGSPENRAASKDLCSIHNHLAANLSSETIPDFEIFLLPESIPPLCEMRVVFFADFSASPRAPPVSPAHP